MLKLFATLKKEFLILIRDIPGLIILFIMPALLIMVVTVAQEKVLRDQSEPTPVLYHTPVIGPLTRQIKEDLTASGLFNPIEDIRGDSISMQLFRELISNGDYQIGIYFLAGDTSIHLLVDPTINPALKKALLTSLKFIIQGSQAKLAVGKISAFYEPFLGEAISMNYILRELKPVHEQYALRDRSTITPTPVQNNIPGFILFGMFFIVIPLSGSVITEKTEGAYLRLRTLPVSVLALLGAKVVLYILICLIQFILMMWVGMYVFPAFLDLPGISIGNHYGEIVIATIAAAFAAVGFGIIVGSASRTHGQAGLFGSVMVVILGILSGAFFPIHLMPKVIQYISYGSPIRWGINNYLEIFIRDGSFRSILPWTFLLISFFILAMMISVIIFAKKKN